MTKNANPKLQDDSASPQGKWRDFSTFCCEQEVFQDSTAECLYKPLDCK